MKKKKKVIISACLLGHLCRYDGKTKKSTEIADAFSEYEIIPFCPEAPVFGTPRERISVVEVDAEQKILTYTSNKDVTKVLEDEISSFIKLHPSADMIVLKSKSPSCGLETTPILNESREKIGIGSGIAAKMFLKNYIDTKIVDEYKI
ncbi:MAG: DUF523 domain-containing protein [Epsilonproteobacteria bacterium]|nr:DUF523 domain-containing protein [Campylobacterota bacterium]